jgi:hypothetical protein
MSIENPPAFPMGDPTHGGYDGMTLRDYFAGQALVTLGGLQERGLPWSSEKSPNGFALAAYELADAMLTARQKGTPDA